MNKLRIGLIVYAESKPTEGGGHSYYSMLLKGINDYDFDPNVEIVNIVFYHGEKLRLNLKKPSIYIKVGYGMQLKVGVKEKSMRAGFRLTRSHPVVNLAVKYILNKRNRKVEKILTENNIDLIYYLKPELDILDYPFIATHWDVAHRSVNAFPEVALNGEYEVREKYYLYTLNKAFLILCESQSGVKELKKFYTLLEDKIKVLPFFPGNVVNEIATGKFESDTLEKYQLQKHKYFVYPAQFWALKNHYNLIIAFNKLLAESNTLKIKLVLTGSDKGNERYIKQLVQSLSLNERVIFPGFVSDAELHVLYRNALGLTMPTFLGPTNLPLLEAAYLYCPVICSNFEGHKELLGTSALYVEPADTEGIKEAMKQLLNQEKGNQLRTSAYEHVVGSHFNLENSLEVLNKVFVETIPYRKTWGN